PTSSSSPNTPPSASDSSSSHSQPSAPPAHSNSGHASSHAPTSAGSRRSSVHPPCATLAGAPRSTTDDENDVWRTRAAVPESVLRKSGFRDRRHTMSPALFAGSPAPCRFSSDAADDRPYGGRPPLDSALRRRNACGIEVASDLAETLAECVLRVNPLRNLGRHTWRPSPHDPRLRRANWRLTALGEETLEFVDRDEA